MAKTKEELDEQKRQNILKAVALIKQANELKDEADKLMEKSGVTLCSIQSNEIHVYSGIIKIAKLFDLKANCPVNVYGEVIKDKRAIEIDGMMLFQIGKPQDRNYCYK